LICDSISNATGSGLLRRSRASDLYAGITYCTHTDTHAHTEREGERERDVKISSF